MYVDTRAHTRTYILKLEWWNNQVLFVERLGLVMFLFYFIVFKVVLENVFVRGKFLLENVREIKVSFKTKPNQALGF